MIGFVEWGKVARFCDTMSRRVRLMKIGLPWLGDG